VLMNSKTDKRRGKWGTRTVRHKTRNQGKRQRAQTGTQRALAFPVSAVSSLTLPWTDVAVLWLQEQPVELVVGYGTKFCVTEASWAPGPEVQTDEELTARIKQYTNLIAHMHTFLVFAVILGCTVDRIRGRVGALNDGLYMV